MNPKDDAQEIDLLPEAVARQVADLARRAQRLNGPLMNGLMAIGGKAEAWAAALPVPVRGTMDGMARGLLERLYTGAGQVRGHLPEAGDWGHRLAASFSGAAGGSVGLASALVELPGTVMLMFGAMQKEAARAGFDPEAPEVRLSCLDIFGAGRPGPEDDGINTTFLGARLAVNAAAVQAVIGRVLPAFSAMLGKSLAGKAVPLIGAVAGAGINYAFTDYYQQVARVRFGLMRLAEDHGAGPIHHAFRAEMAERLTV
ncbi:MAG: EcsC family protein [Rhodobacteraceae bacterium]|nr:EcsC family protein [Paracoccaceae bacterium]